MASLPIPALRRYMTVMLAGNLLWEVAHMPLYTLWLTGTPAEIAYSVLHCTLGDGLIAATTLGLALFMVGHDWPERRTGSVAAVTIGLALAYTIFSEWLNISVRGSWAYRDIMPVLPPFGTGLTPLLQWIVLPLCAFTWATRPRTAP